jgi:hypothetical protein
MVLFDDNSRRSEKSFKNSSMLMLMPATLANNNARRG